MSIAFQSWWRKHRAKLFDAVNSGVPCDQRALERLGSRMWDEAVETAAIGAYVAARERGLKAKEAIAIGDDVARGYRTDGRRIKRKPSKKRAAPPAKKQ